MWIEGYPDIDDLLDSFSEVKDPLEFEKYSKEAMENLQYFQNSEKS